MDIKLPWKKLGWDGKKHRAKLTIWYWTTQQEENMESLEKNQQEFFRQKDTTYQKKLKHNSLRKCPGHKKGSPIYDNKGQCNICGGYKINL